MHILVDLQGAQTRGSRHRGIGRYSLALTRELLSLAPRRGHRVSIMLNAAFPDALVDLRAKLVGLADPGAIHVWQPPAGAGGVVRDDEYTRAAALVREAVIEATGADAVLVASLFEGFGDEAVATVGTRHDGPLAAVVLYDLIPYIQPQVYLGDPVLARLYHGQVNELRRADLALAISESARQEALLHLGMPEQDVVTISSAADGQFVPRTVPEAERKAVLARYGLRRRVVMFTGGLDARKNIDALIRAYAMVPAALRRDTTLAIVCAANDDEKRLLQATGAGYSLFEDDLRVTGYVPEDDLIALYGLCALFVFPSLHEGFGLPALEAMACGAPVIGSDRSSIPEVIGAPEALFDPEDEPAMAAMIGKALSDQGYAAWLRARAPVQAARFSWTSSAERALDAIEAKLLGRTQPRRAVPVRRARLALVSPVPPQRTGIAGYVATLAPELARHYDIDFVRGGDATGSPDMQGIGVVLSPEEFDRVAGRYDRIVYQLGNSDFHAHMPELMARHPGVVVLHDLTLSGLANWKDVAGGSPGYWTARIRDEAGYVASLERLLARSDGQHDALQRRHACTADAVRHATGIIVHSDHARGVLAAAHGEEVAARTHVIPLVSRVRPLAGRAAARKRLGYTAADTVVCCFGAIAPSKRHDVLLEAWFESTLASDPRCRLVLVGEVGETPFGRRLLRAIAVAPGGERVRVTGYVQDEVYAEYLLAADIAVQLRDGHRGESSAAVADVLAAAVPLVASGGGAFGEIPEDCARKLSAQPGTRELVDAIEWMAGHPEERKVLGQRAREHASSSATPRRVAELYRDMLERQTGRLAVREETIRAMRTTLHRDTIDARAVEIGRSLGRSLASRPPRRRLLIDVTGLDQASRPGKAATRAVSDLLRQEVAPFATEPFLMSGGVALLARHYTYSLLDHPEAGQLDEAFEPLPGDACLGFFTGDTSETGHLALYEQCRVWGIPVTVVCTDAMLEQAEQRSMGFGALLTRTAAYADLVLVETTASVARLASLLDEAYPLRSDPLGICAVLPSGGEGLADVLGEALAGASRRHSTWTPRKRLVVPADSPLLNIGTGVLYGRRIRTTARGGWLLFGPYLPIPAGSYTLTVSITVHRAAGALLEVCHRGGTILAQTALAPQARPVEMRLDVPPGVQDLEVRLSVSDETRLVFEGYRIDPSS